MSLKAVWTTLKDDGSLQESLADINAGQSHRARLVADETLSSFGMSHEPVKGYQRGSIGRSRGSGRGGRGGGHAGAGRTRVDIKRFVLALPI